ncbi:MAG: UDP-N-acetylmuramate--alanine ligase [Brockia lithotrophica]|uniref:UDP-N-acetylmuramate--L-alanine ligase n=1 Tax=Brockia lithotrophica TaxID=933949 RepID=A0A2T5G7D2_9BACL|nr:MAG: UDP-N-acetylmuramate--alanine ligase [Brockia lithotrophica]
MNVRHLHFIGIGGTGMSALARVFLARGVRVSGSDVADRPILRVLREEGATVYVGHRPEHVNGAEAVVYTSDVPEDNVEFVEAARRGLPLFHRSDLLALLLNEARGVAVAGSHGKTTTTAMIAFVLREAGADPTYLIGGEIIGEAGNARAGKGDLVVAEADESDRTFLKYAPSVAVLTNLESDHLENYGGSFVSLRDAFEEFVCRVRPDGTLVAGWDDPSVREILAKAKARCSGRFPEVVRYALVAEDVEVRGEALVSQGGKYRFRIREGGIPAAEVSLGIYGRHHVYNALAAYAVLRRLGIAAEEIARHLARYPGVHRRFEVLGEAHGVLAVDDYAVHPTEIAATLATARETGRRVVAVFQPHRRARAYYLFREFLPAFRHADLVLVLPVYSPKNDRKEFAIEGWEFVEGIARESGVPAAYLPSLDVALAWLEATLRPGDLLLTLGAGDVRRLGERWVEQGRATSGR